MSGGSMNYIYRRVEDASDYIDDREIKDLLNDLAELLHDYEWWDSGDYSKSTYIETLDKFKAKWFGKDKKSERVKKYVAESLDKLKEEIETL